MENAEVAAVFDQIADILEIRDENAFRIRSYRNAARAIRDHAERMEDLAVGGADLTDLPGIGKSLAEKIHAILATGTCPTLEDLHKEIPPHLTDLLRVKGLGAKRAKLLCEKLGISTLGELKKYAEAGEIRDIEGMGEKTEQNILKGLATLEAEAGRISIKTAAEQSAAIGRHLDRARAVKRWEPAGSFRRRRETIGDLDILVLAANRAKAVEQILAYEPIEDRLAVGEEKVSVRLASGLEVDFRFFDAAEFGAAMMYFTGSKAHNIAVRKRAQKRKWKLNEYGLFAGKRRIAGKSEEEVYKKLGLAWVPPELREDRGEVEAAEENRLPALIEEKDIRGDMHIHTDATDGRATVEEMVEAARRRGYRYLAITDHSQAVTVAHGLTAERLRRHADRVRELAGRLKHFRLLAGIEVDILKDGRLDLPEKVLEGLDWVVASVHSRFEMDEAKMTERLLAAIGSGVVDCIGHPFGRLIGSRDPIRFDADRVFEACREHGVCLEINSYPDRLDLPDIYCKRAKEAGVTMAISTDAHKPADLDLMPFGVSVARRGWLEKGDVLNTLSAAALRKRLKSRD
ncbi:MAG TPA: DNA polymerase/3'-5' exonuclease PolX [Phycisphaerae bacterium]|nr:DNA polymerase/3'-5' exonuclease PolX [Phycisphaerae bacterium]